MSACCVRQSSRITTAFAVWGAHSSERNRDEGMGSRRRRFRFGYPVSRGPAGSRPHVDVREPTTGSRTERGHRARGADDATRLAYVEVLTDAKAITAIGFLRRAVKHFSSYGITVERLLTDNGPAYRSTPGTPRVQRAPNQAARNLQFQRDIAVNHSTAALALDAPAPHSLLTRPHPPPWRPIETVGASTPQQPLRGPQSTPVQTRRTPGTPRHPRHPKTLSTRLDSQRSDAPDGADDSFRPGADAESASTTATTHQRRRLASRLIVWSVGRGDHVLANCARDRMVYETARDARDVGGPS